MVPIILGAILGTAAAGWLAIHFVKKDLKNRRATWGRIDTALSVTLFFICALILGTVLGSVGLVVSFLSPTPPIPVEESVIVEKLLPFPKDNETDSTIYTIKSGMLYRQTNMLYLVRYNDHTRIVKALCCNGTTTKLIEGEGTPSIKKYRRPGHLGLFSFRMGHTWYEVHVPPNTVATEDLIPVKIPR